MGKGGDRVGALGEQVEVWAGGAKPHVTQRKPASTVSRFLVSSLFPVIVL